ncbi:Fic family protein [Terasakiella sp. SH-1]|uniref:Fic family protein n=1 Tax=Terasakiella sp. SH-1 TaxID=2560057 RepID=UPI00107472A7|nr:Fic family protein [Terasakiella sp. SH-1]
MAAREQTGQFINGSAVAGDTYQAYIPDPLPPTPPLDMGQLYPLLDQASTALGRLDGMSMILPDSKLFLYMYVRKEAVLSSQIEGTQSSLSDLLLFETEEAPGAPIDDVTEVSCYVAAMNYGLDRLKEFPLSLRLIREIHAELMNNARGGDKQPGAFRASQNWVGGTRPSRANYVPPPPEKMGECLNAFELFLHDEKNRLPALIKAALAHVQFESIHPFLDGNGRLGRLLITFILCTEGILKEPLLYLSLYFKANRQAYYDHVQNVRETGDWEAWIEFFLEGVIDTANQATATARAIMDLFEADRFKIGESGKSTAAVLTIHTYLQSQPIANTGTIKEACNVSLPTVLRSLTALEDLGIVREVTGKERNKVFVYQDYISILSSGTEPIAR